MIKVFWQREWRAIQWHQCRLLTRQLLSVFTSLVYGKHTFKTVNKINAWVCGLFFRKPNASAPPARTSEWDESTLLETEPFRRRVLSQFWSDVSLPTFRIHLSYALRETSWNWNDAALPWKKKNEKEKKKSVLVFSSGRPSWFRVTSKFGIKFLTLQRDHNAELVVLKVSCELWWIKRVRNLSCFRMKLQNLNVHPLFFSMFWNSTSLEEVRSWFHYASGPQGYVYAVICCEYAIICCPLSASYSRWVQNFFRKSVKKKSTEVSLVSL